MREGFSVEYSDDRQQVCIIPKYFISTEELTLLINFYIKMGYIRWIPSDERQGYFFRKDNMLLVDCV